jgi:hypothetical protein
MVILWIMKCSLVTVVEIARPRQVPAVTLLGSQTMYFIYNSTLFVRPLFCRESHASDHRSTRRTPTGSICRQAVWEHTALDDSRSESRRTNTVEPGAVPVPVADMTVFSWRVKM